jgi:hypothetical protein
MHRYYESKEIKTIQKIFTDYLRDNHIQDYEKVEPNDLRSLIFSFFDLHEFKKGYLNLTRQIAVDLGISLENLVVQTTPTPRVSLPNAHGTSFHCDYWYGHGLKSYTVWTPLSRIESGNTFYVCNEDEQSEYLKLISDIKLFLESEDKLLANSFEVLPDPGSCFVFDSEVMHGSPKNTTLSTRLSFDFRFGEKFDKTSTKDLENYYHWKDGEFFIPEHKLKGKRILKYICGGVNKNTFAQHAIIQESAKRYDLSIVEQEAEIERYGFPMLSAYINGDLASKNIEAIIIASESIFDEKTLYLIKNSDLKVWSALENKFIN